MNKKLIAAAIAAALAAPAAYADATVYGQLKMWVSSTNSGESMSTNGSRLGFKGSEDLGNGMKAVYKIELGLNFDDPNSSTDLTNTGLTSRSQYVGLAGNFGTVMFGKRETNYLLTTAKLDMFGDTLADYNKLIGFDESGTMGTKKLNSRPNNAIHYVSPSFSGFSVSAGLYGDDTDLNGTGYDIAAVYKNGGIYASVAHAEDEVDGSDATRVGLGYKMDAIKVSAVYEDQGAADLWQLSGAYTMGNNTLKATFGDNNGSGKGNGWAIGVDHKMSKRTKVYALYADSDNSLNGDSVSGDGFAVGMQHNF
jgi:predicted porin